MQNVISYKGKLCTLRPLKKEDAAISIQWRNNPQLRAQAMSYRFPVTQQMENEWYENALNNTDKNAAFFAIDSLQHQEFVGFIMLKNIDWIARTAYLGIILGNTQAQHKGIGSEAVNLLLHHAFEVFNLRKICIEVADYNNKALNFWKKMKFQTEGCLKQQYFMGNTYHDVHLMAIFEEDFVPQN